MKNFLSKHESPWILWCVSIMNLCLFTSLELRALHLLTTLLLRNLHPNEFFVIGNPFPFSSVGDGSRFPCLFFDAHKCRRTLVFPRTALVEELQSGWMREREREFDTQMRLMSWAARGGWWVWLFVDILESARPEETPESLDVEVYLPNCLCM